MFALKRTTDGKYVAKPGSKNSYTRFLQYARIFLTREDAERDRCPENERVVEVATMSSAKSAPVFLNAYIVAALWSSTDENDIPLDQAYTAGDISGDLMDKMIEDCVSFLAKAEIPNHLLPQAGHDFWLTRNGHGTGFWARPEVYGEKKAQELTKLAESFGPVDLYIGDDGRIYA